MPWLLFNLDGHFVSAYPGGKRVSQGEIVELIVMGYNLGKQAFEVKLAGKIHYFVTGDTHLHNFLCVNLQHHVWLWMFDGKICYTESEL